VECCLANTVKDNQHLPPTDFCHSPVEKIILPAQENPTTDFF